MSKIHSETFWMREPCRNTNGMPFVRGFFLAIKGTACSTQSRSFLLRVEQLDGHGFSGSFIALKEKEVSDFRGFLQAVPCLKLSTKHMHRNTFRYTKPFRKERHVSFSIHRVPFWISAHWKISHKACLYILISLKAASLGTAAHINSGSAQQAQQCW